MTQMSELPRDAHPHDAAQLSGTQSEHAPAWRLRVNTILVVGIDTVIGGNLAAHFAGRHSVTGLSASGAEQIAGVQIGQSAEQSPESWIAEVNPNWIIYCGPESRSAWDPATAQRISETCASTAEAWGHAAHDAGLNCTMVSSDAVFTGPWMFHDEESACHSRCDEAECIRASEKAMRRACPESLIVRSHVFGWSPSGDAGWLETLLEAIEQRRGLDQDCIRHATPILATDLADILERAQEERLSGTYHVAGAERISPVQFAQRLADQFALPWLSVRREEVLDEPADGFGAGETSLQTKNVRKALCVAMPMLTEGLARLHAQALNGFREAVCPAATAFEKVA